MQLLISVKSVEESLVARYADVDLIDLKDPSNGALGALDLDVTAKIVSAIKGSAVISATVGEGHASVDELITDIEAYANVGVNIIKIAVSDLFQAHDFLPKIQQLTNSGIQLVAVCFADVNLIPNVIPMLKTIGFYGVMLDTQDKQHTLLDVQTEDQLGIFVRLCRSHGLISGLAGSMSKDNVDTLLTINPTFIGMRGGVCLGGVRAGALSADKVNEVKCLLLNSNKGQQVSQKIVDFDLHI